MTLRVVILAAGESARLGEPKALARIGPRTALAHLAAAASAIDPRPIVVAGAHADRIERELPQGCVLALNPNWRAGRLAGIAVARELAGFTDLCLAPVDVPLVEAQVFEALANAWRDAGEPPEGWLAPRSAPSGRHGHPVIAGRALLARLEGVSILRELRAAARPLLEVEVASIAVLDDVDTPEDLLRLRERFP